LLFLRLLLLFLLGSVVDPHHFDADPDKDPDSTYGYHPDADPDSDFLFGADPYPTFHPDADPTQFLASK
jgi:hypothetical protein